MSEKTLKLYYIETPTGKNYPEWSINSDEACKQFKTKYDERISHVWDTISVNR